MGGPVQSSNKIYDLPKVIIVASRASPSRLHDLGFVDMLKGICVL